MKNYKVKRFSKTYQKNFAYALTALGRIDNLEDLPDKNLKNMSKYKKMRKGTLIKGATPFIGSTTAAGIAHAHLNGANKIVGGLKGAAIGTGISGAMVIGGHYNSKHNAKEAARILKLRQEERGYSETKKKKKRLDPSLRSALTFGSVAGAGLAYEAGSALHDVNPIRKAIKVDKKLEDEKKAFEEAEKNMRSSELGNKVKEAEIKNKEYWKTAEEKLKKGVSEEEKKQIIDTLNKNKRDIDATKKEVEETITKKLIPHKEKISSLQNEKIQHLDKMKKNLSKTRFGIPNNRLIETADTYLKGGKTKGLVKDYVKKTVAEKSVTNPLVLIPGSIAALSVAGYGVKKATD